LDRLELLACLLIGCTQVTGPSDDTAPLTLTVLTVVRGEVTDEEAPLDGVRLCEADTQKCDETGPDGTATLQLPVGKAFTFTLQKEGWPSYSTGGFMRPDGLEHRFVMQEDSEMEDRHVGLMTPYPLEGTGTVLIEISPGIAGATFELVDDNGSPRPSPYYIHELGFWFESPRLETTTIRGSGGFIELSPRDTQVQLGGSAKKCEIVLGWSGSGEDTLWIPVREGHIGVAQLACPLSARVELAVFASDATGPSQTGTEPPLEGVEVCEIDNTSNCAVTDENGEARIKLPREQLTGYTISKDGYVPWLVGDVTDDTFSFSSAGWTMFTDELAADATPEIGTPDTWTGGWVALRAFPLMAGVTYELLDTTAAAYYTDEEGLVDVDLTETTSDGDGGFIEVPPGVRQVEFGGTAKDCEAAIAWPGDADAPNQIKIPIRTGYITYGNMNCAAK